jgi:hypothetical protein
MSAGKTAARGYSYKHQRSRREWAPLVEAGQVDCWRCRRLIVDGKIRTATGRWVTNWHMGHQDNDRTLPALPEHVLCNLAAAGRKAGRLQRARAGRRRPRVVAAQVYGPLSQR